MIDWDKEKREKIKKGFQTIINQNSMEAGPNMPDFILAELMVKFYENFVSTYNKDEETLDAYFLAVSQSKPDLAEPKHLEGAKTYFEKVEELTSKDIENAFAQKEKWHVNDHIRAAFILII